MEILANQVPEPYEGERREDVHEDLPEVEHLVVVPAEVPAQDDDVAKREDGHHCEPDEALLPLGPKHADDKERQYKAEIQPPVPDELHVRARLFEAEVRVAVLGKRGRADEIAEVYVRASAAEPSVQP